jgi:ABC-type antimicrobial peptide transport system permease subunit
MTITERATVAVFGVLLACIFGVLLAWILVMAVAVGTDDKGKTASTEKKTGTSTEKIEILRARPVPITAPEPHFMRPHFIPMGRDDARIWR